jgi:hypothetical protein
MGRKIKSIAQSRLCGRFGPTWARLPEELSLKRNIVTEVG